MCVCDLHELLYSVGLHEPSHSIRSVPELIERVLLVNLVDILVRRHEVCISDSVNRSLLFH